ncbi:MAG: DUF4013 domain-containing protein [Puniceicoccaceae bacterium]
MEKITWRIWESEGFNKALLIGGLVFYVPIINLVLLGYYGCWVKQLVRSQGIDLPEWRDGKAILEELIRVLAPFLVWVFLPVLLAFLLFWASSGLLNLLYLGLFARTVAYIPLAIVAVLCPVAFTTSLICLYKSNSLSTALNLQIILPATMKSLREALFPLFVYYGITAIGWPLVGFASFAATLPLLAQLVLILREKDHDFTSEA